MSWGAEPPADRPKPVGPSNDWERTGVRAVKKRNRSLLLGILAAGAITLVVLVALAPALVSGIAKSAIENGGSDAIAGRVTVDSVSLSWTGPQRVKSLRVLTPSDERVARVDVEMTAGLIGLVFGSRDLGEVRVSGEAEIVRDATGVSNLDRAISGEPRASSAGASAPRSAARRSGPLFTVPEGFAADLELGGLTVLYRDASLEAASSGRVLAGGVRDLRGAVRVAAGEATTADLRGVLFVARQGASGLTDRGSVRVVMGADGLIGANGNASLDRATLAVEITADALGTEALFALTGGAIPALWAEPGLIDRAIGPTVRLSLAGEGTAERFLLNTTVEAEHIAITAPALLLGRTVIEARQPVTARLGLDRLALLNPGSTAALSGSAGVEISALPEARLTVSSLNWPTPVEGPGSVRRLAFNGAIALGEIAGRLGGDDAEARPFRIPASTLTASSSGLASGASVAWSTPVEIDGASSGSIAIDLSANEVLDAAGGFAPARALATLSGRATLDNLPTAVASSLASAFGAGDVVEGVNLPQALGPRLRASLEAQPAASGTSITIALTGEHADIAARLISDGSVLTAASSGGGSPVLVELRRPGALLDAGVRLGGLADTAVTLASPLVIAVDRLTLRTDGLDEGPLNALDLDGSVRIERINAQLRGTPTAFRAIDFAFGVGGGGVSARGGVQVGANNSPLGRITAENFRVTLGDAPAVAGSLVMDALPASFIEALAGPGLALADIVGPTVSGRVTSAPASGGATDLDASINSGFVTGRATLRLDRQAVRLTGDGVRVSHGAPRLLAERFTAVDPELLRWNDGGEIELRSTDLSFDLAPTDPNAAPLARLRGTAIVEARGLRAQTSAGPMAVRTLRASSEIASTGRLESSFTAQFDRAGAAFGGEGRVTATGLDRPGTTPALDATVALTGVPTDLVAAFIPSPDPRLASGAAVPQSAEERTRAITEALGPVFDARFALSPSDASLGLIGARQVSAEIRSRGLTGRGSGVLPADGGFAAVRALTADLSVTLAPGLVDSLTGAFAAELAGSLPRIADRGDLRLRVDRATPADPLTMTATSERLVLTRVPGLPDPTGVLAVSGLRAELAADPASFSATGAPGTKPLRSSLRGVLSDAGGGAAGTIDAALNGLMGANGPTGAWTGQVNATGVAGAWLDRVLGREGRASGFIGRSADLRLDAKAELRGRRVREDRAGERVEVNKTDIQGGELTLTVSGERLDAPRPLVLTIADGALRSGGAWELQSRAGPEALNAWLAPAEGEPSLRITAVRPVRFSIDELVLPIGEDTRPAAVRGADGIAVKLRAALTTLEVAMQTVPRDGSAAMPIAYANPTLRVQLQTGGGGAVTGQASVIADQTRPEPRERAIAITVDAENMRSPDGAISLANGVYSSDIRVGGLPTALLDSIGGLDGWLGDVVGPTLNVQGRLIRVSPNEGRVSLGVVGDNGEMTYSGSVRGGPAGSGFAGSRLVSENSPRVVFHTISDAASARIREAARVFERLEKHRALDAQAEIVAESLTIPFQGGIAAYDARLRVDLGDLRYTFVPRLDRLVRDERQPSTAGLTDLRAERFRPFEARMSNGVVFINGANFPLGGEVITAMARADFVQKTEQATLLIPARIARVDAFDREILGRAISAGGSMRIDRAGALGEAEWGSPELIFDPGKVLEKAVEEGLRELFRRGIGG